MRQNNFPHYEWIGLQARGYDLPYLRPRYFQCSRFGTLLTYPTGAVRHVRDQQWRYRPARGHKVAANVLMLTWEL